EVVTGWAAACVPYGGAAGMGTLFVPEVDAGVWVEFEEGDLEFPVWVGTFWSRPGGESQLPKPNGPDGAEEGSVQSPPTRKVVKTLAGHTLQFEDADDEVRVLVADGQNENRIVLGRSGLTVVYKGSTVTLSDDGIVIEDASGNALTQSAAGTVLEDANGNTITMDATSGGIPGTPGIAVNGPKKVCLEGLVSFLISHTHIGNMGAPCPLNPADIAKLTAALALPDGDILSQKTTLG
ncbi:MAG TPA: phage baseplate assembly protein V, partial [Longimicrobiaceae bacterium]|nr:phage baseplate assembly protein V [Longimicrobiaceae bacterium]